MEEDKYKTLESLRETKKFLNGIKCYLKEDEESVELDTLAAIALLRRPELAKRGDEAFGEKNSNFTRELYNYINFTVGSETIISRTMEIEALIRCAEAHNKGMTSEEIYKKHLGLEESENSVDNLYFNKRLNIDQKKFVAINYDYIFSDVQFLLTYGKDFKYTDEQKAKKNTK